MLTITNIQPKPRRIAGQLHQRPISDTYNADIEKNKSIRLYGTYRSYAKDAMAFDRTFKIGDRCVYDSYNLVYTGEIIAIGEKTVKVHKGGYPEGDNVQLSLYDFAWRNWDYDAARIAERNSNWSD